VWNNQLVLRRMELNISANRVQHAIGLINDRLGLGNVTRASTHQCRSMTVVSCEADITAIWNFPHINKSPLSLVAEKETQNIIFGKSADKLLSTWCGGITPF
jgi:hypothetical protein